MKEVPLQEFMDLAVINEASFTPLKMLDPVAARILKIWRKVSLYPAAFYRSREGTGCVQRTDIPL